MESDVLVERLDLSQLEYDDPNNKKDTAIKEKSGSSGKICIRISINSLKTLFFYHYGLPVLRAGSCAIDFQTECELEISVFYLVHMIRSLIRTWK